MLKITRLIILLICAVLFLIIMPYILLYSLGYRLDFENRKIVTTGGIYVKALPQPVEVTIDSTINNKTGLFFNAVFVQNLLPKQHSVLIKKEGYYDYQKNLPVKENEVTKLEHVILFKKNIAFEVITDKSQSLFNQQSAEDKFVIKNNNLYYANIPDNANLTQTQKNTAVIKNIIAYKISDNRIIWLGLDGFLHGSDVNRENTQKLSETKLEINAKNTYNFFIFNQEILLKENNNVLLLDRNTKTFKDFYSNVKDIKMSPNGQRLLYYNDHEILFSDINQLNEKVFLNRFSDTIHECYWLNDDYIIFQLGNRILISEIDVRDTVNPIELPQTVSLTNGDAVDLKNIKISFSQQDKKLYILNQNTTLVSERLVP